MASAPEKDCCSPKAPQGYGHLALGEHASLKLRQKVSYFFQRADVAFTITKHTQTAGVRFCAPCVRPGTSHPLGSKEGQVSLLRPEVSL